MLFVFFAQDIHRRRIILRLSQCPGSAIPLAAFQVSTDGRFWVSTEVREARWSGGVGQVRIVHRTGGQRTLKIDRIINCTGIHESYTDNPRPLIQSLVDNGLAQANELGIGFRTDRHGALLNGEMRPSPVFFTLGPPRRGELFETTAVPEIRAQAEVLAAHVLRQTHIHPPAEVRLSPAWQPSAMD